MDCVHTIKDTKAIKAIGLVNQAYLNFDIV